MTISVTEPVNRAFDRTRTLLLEPFDPKRWFYLGFIAWLAQLGEGGGTASLPTGEGDGSGGGLASDLEMGLLVAIGVAIAVVAIGFGILALWLSSRGKLMFVEAVATGEVAIVDGWKRWREIGQRYFWLRLGLVSAFVVVVVLVAVALGATFYMLESGKMSAVALAGVVAAGLVLLVAIIVYGIAESLIGDFLVPASYVLKVGPGPAWRQLRRDVLDGRTGTIVLFYLMKTLLGMGIAVIAIVATCLTLCLAALPYLGVVLLLPLHVFLRAYSLHFIEQFGWKVFRAGGEKSAEVFA